VNEQPPADVLARLVPIPTYRDHPATVPHDIDGVGLDGCPRQVSIVGSGDRFLLLFLSSHCQGCRDLWEGIDTLRDAIPAGVRIVLLTKGPEADDAAVVAALASPGSEVIMSSQAYGDYLVAGPPFLAVVAGGKVQTEGVAWGIGETARATRVALGDDRS
jgi:hypothetical protein